MLYESGLHFEVYQLTRANVLGLIYLNQIDMFFQRITEGWTVRLLAQNIITKVSYTSIGTQTAKHQKKRLYRLLRLIYNIPVSQNSNLIGIKKVGTIRPIFPINAALAGVYADSSHCAPISIYRVQTWEVHAK